jgi:hypothetical protein
MAGPMKKFVGLLPRRAMPIAGLILIVVIDLMDGIKISGCVLG